MAYTRKRGKAWSYTVDVGRDPVSGERKQETKSGFRTKREAEIAAAKIETDVATGVYIKETNATFEEYAETWLKVYRSGRPKASSIRQREYQVQSLNNCFGKVKISSITRKKYRESMLELSDKIARNTLIGIHSVAKMVFRLAVEDGDIKTDPTEFVRMPAPDTNEEAVPKYMEKEHLAEFLRLAKLRGLDCDYEMFTLLAYTGIRVGESCALKWSDIDFDACTVSINGTLHNPDDISTSYEIFTPKTKSSRRTIDVDKSVLVILDKLRTRQNEFRMLHRKTYHDAGFVFGRMDTPAHSPKGIHYGYPTKRRTVELRMDRITQWMNLPVKLTPHSLRHTHTSLCAEAGVSLEAIMERLGHKNDTITRTVYLHVTKSLKKEAADKFSALMSGVVKL